MAQPPSITLDPFKYLKTLPEFNGNRNDLYNFITLVDRIYPVLTQYDETSQLFFSDIIKSRLQNKAREIIEINFHVRSWADIKNVLINNFGEKRSLEELYDNMRSVVFNTNTSDFYNEIKDKLRKLNNKTSLIMGENPGSETIATNNMKSALNIFKGKIPEPMKTVLACRNPNSLEEAMEILFNSGYAHYGNGKTENYSRNKNYNKQNYRNDQKNNSYQQESHSQPRYRPNYNSQANYPNNYNRQSRQYRSNDNNNSSQQRNFPNFQNRQNLNLIHQQGTNPIPQYRSNYNSNQMRNFPNSYNRNDQPEPMDVNVIQNVHKNQTYENFRVPASQEPYPI